MKKKYLLFLLNLSFLKIINNKGYERLGIEDQNFDRNQELSCPLANAQVFIGTMLKKILFST